MIARRIFFRKLLGSLLVSAWVPEMALAAGKRRAETPSPTSTPILTPQTPQQDSTAKIRLWKANDLPDRTIQVRFLVPGKTDAEAVSPLQIEPEGYQFSKYVDVPAGKAVAEVSATDRSTVLLPVILAEDGHSTLLVRAQGTTLTAEWIDETPVPADSGCEFRIYNLLPASGDIQIDLGTILTVHLSSIHSSLRLVGIKRGNYVVTVAGNDGNGKNFHWNTEADFRQTRKATLLIYPDAYGRIRPRVNTA